MSMKNLYPCLRIFSIAVLLMGGLFHAYGQIVDYQYEIRFKDGRTGKVDSTQAVYYYHRMNADKARETYEKANTAAKLFELEDQLRSLGFKRADRGRFTFPGRNGMGVVIRTKDDDLYLIIHNDGNWEGKIMSEGCKASCSAMGQGKFRYIITIDNNTATDSLNVLGEDRTPPPPPSGNIDLRDGNDRFDIHLAIPDSFTNHNARIILRPYAVDCLSDDTIAYLRPAAYEGKEYHYLQEKRKAYDYYRHDPIGRRYHHIQIRENFDTTKVLRTETIREDLKDADGNVLRDEYNIKRDTIYTLTHMVDSISKHTDTLEYDHSGYIMPIENMRRERNMIYIDTVIVFRRPVRDRRNRGQLSYTIENYHRKFYEGTDPGTCLVIDPYKFLEMSTAMINFELNNDFYEVADETPDSMNQVIPIQFHYNSAIIKEDSTYIVSIRRLEHDMREIISRGGVLTNATITGYASPDGPADRNISLARQRAQAARGKINAPGGSRIEIRPLIDTWQHTAELLEEAGYAAEAKSVREAIASTSSNKAVEDIVKASPSYQDIIKPILEKQCRINFSYQYFSERKLEPDEAKDYYYRDRHRFFSNGDYFNLFSTITDSLELDSLTEIAYDRVIVQNGAYSARIAPYIINRKAVLNAKRGIFDPKVLQPLIWEVNGNIQIDFRREYGGIRYNRPEILLNQAIVYFQQGEPEHARLLIDKLKRIHFDSPNLSKLDEFLKFKDLYGLVAENRATKRQREDFRRALKFIEDSGPDNKAVLYTEFEKLNKQKTDAWEYVHLMDDSNPRKWYLMGILWSLRDGQETDYPLPTANDATIGLDDPTMTDEDEQIIREEDPARYEQYLQEKQAYQKALEERRAQLHLEDADDIDVNVKGIPYYMAYFWKSFDLENKRLRESGVEEKELWSRNVYVKHYFNEGHIQDMKRKKKNHAFKMNRIPAYRKIFRLRKIDDDKQRKEFLKEHQIDQPAEEEFDTNIDE